MYIYTVSVSAAYIVSEATHLLVDKYICVYLPLSHYMNHHTEQLDVLLYHIIGSLCAPSLAVCVCMHYSLLLASSSSRTAV
jgi:hypothetical protein